MHRLALALVPVFALSGTALAATAAAPPSPHATAVTADYAVPRGPVARRITAALNVLEAKGYGDFANFHATGSGFAATVTKNGRQIVVAIDPDTRTVTTQG